VNVAFDKTGWEDCTSWAGELKMLRRINRMIEEALRDPGQGIGKPEPLTENLGRILVAPDHRRASARLYRPR